MIINIEGIFEKITVIVIHENLLFLTVGQKFYEPWVTSSRNLYELIIDLENYAFSNVESDDAIKSHFADVTTA